MNDLKIVATIIAKKGHQASVKEAIELVAVGSRKEQGNRFYHVCEAVEDPLKFVFLENWESQEALNIHRQTKHYLDYKKAVEGKTESVHVDILREFGL